MEERELIKSKIIETIGEYTIVMAKEKAIDSNGEQYGYALTWFDICLDNGDGDIVASFKTIKEARKWIKEN